MSTFSGPLNSEHLNSIYRHGNRHPKRAEPTPKGKTVQLHLQPCQFPERSSRAPTSSAHRPLLKACAHPSHRTYTSSRTNERIPSGISEMRSNRCVSTTFLLSGRSRKMNLSAENKFDRTCQLVQLPQISILNLTCGSMRRCHVRVLVHGGSGESEDVVQAQGRIPDAWDPELRLTTAAKTD